MSPRPPRSAAFPALLLAASLAAGAPALGQPDDGAGAEATEEVAKEAADGEASAEVEASATISEATALTPEEEALLEFREPVDVQKMDLERQLLQMRDGNRLRPRVSRYLERAQKELDRGQPEEAERLLLRLAEGRLNPLELAQVDRFLGFLAFNAGDSVKAIKFFKQAIDREALQVSVDTGLRFGIAQIYLTLEEWEQALEWFHEGMRYTPEYNPDHLYFMALAHFQTKRFQHAIAFTKKAIEISPPPKEPWLRLLSALYAQDEKYAKSVPVLEELLIRYPSKAYWVQLSLLYAAKNEYDTSLAVQQAAYQQDFLTDSKELMRFARSYLYHDLPYPAAQLLSRELDAGRVERDRESYEMLANSWIAARDYDASLSPLRKAAELAEDGKLYVRLGQVHMQREEWSEAIAMLEQAFRKGGLDKLGQAHLLLGISQLNLERPRDARASFEKARVHEESRAEAERWIEHIEREQSQQEQAA